MTDKGNRNRLRSILLAATALCAASSGTAVAQDANRPIMAEITRNIIVNDNIDPNAPAPGGALDLSGVTLGLASGVNGIGQMTVRASPLNTGLFLCTGTLINPRTVIFAAHCVNDLPMNAYGPNGVPTAPFAGGVPIAFGFGANNLPAVRQWLGLASAPGAGDANPALLHATNEARALYNVEQVWYDPRSVALGFLEADVALATLDTPAFDVPMWTLLFSPLTEETHSTIVGYGVNGTHSSAQGPGGCPQGPPPQCGPLGGIDFRRRAAENMLSALGSLDDVFDFLFGPAPASLVQSLYQQDFDSTAGQAAFDPAAFRFDFDLFDGALLPREGITAGGDSGGPLIVDQKFSKPVVAAVLSGGVRYFDEQRFSTYGTSNFYQPLFLFWDAIVANNSYAYVGNKPGVGAWENPARWVQLMDPAYSVERGGKLVNDLPDTPALGVSGNTVKFGQVCFLDDCTDLADDPTATPPPVGSGKGLFIPGGPGTRNFVPDNVVANPGLGIRARYYDVTLSAPGLTTLASSRTIDRLTIDGLTALDIKPAGDLRVIGDFTQWRGLTNVDGTLRSGEALIASGVLAGKGLVDPTFLTIGNALVLPGGAREIGTLTIRGDLVLSSHSIILFDANRFGADKLIVLGDALNPGIAALDGTAAFDKPRHSSPRHGQTFEIINAAGGVLGTFDQVVSFTGSLKPHLIYNPNTVLVNLRAGKLADNLADKDGIAKAFADALDALRDRSYDDLYGLYGAVDLMDAQELTMTLRGLAPTAAMDARALQDDQSRVLLTGIADRLSIIGRPENDGKLSIIGAPDSLILSAAGLPEMRPHSTVGLVPRAGSAGLPSGMSGFVAGGYAFNGSAPADQRLPDGSERSWHIATGLELAVSDSFTLGTAFGYSEGYSRQGAARGGADARTSQMAVYGSYDLGRGFYVGGLGAAEFSSVSYDRRASSGEALFDLTGASRAERYTAMIEAGANLGIGSGLALTPRLGLGYSSFALTDYRETGGELALRIDDLNVRRFTGRVGLKLSGETRLGGWTVVPQLQGDYVRRLGGSSGSIDVRFAQADSHLFTLPIGDTDDGWAEVKGGLRLVNGPLEFGAGVEASLGRSDYRDERATADLTIRF